MNDDEAGIPEDDSSGCEMVTLEAADMPVEKAEPAQTTMQQVKVFLQGKVEDLKRAVTGEKLPEWLVRTWNFAGKKPEYIVYELRWQDEYPNLWQLVKQAVKDGLIDARSTPEPDPRYPDGTPNEHLIMLKPRTLEMVRAATREKPGPRSNRTEMRIDGKDIDLRNRANFDLLNARIEDVENVAQSYLHQFRIEGVTKGQRRRLICELHRVVLLRGRELSRPLYGSICLRVGMPLPADFWTLPAEMLPETGEVEVPEVEVECR